EKGNYRLREMMKPIFKNGNLVYDSPSVTEIKEYAENEKNSLGEEYKRLTYPHIMKVDLSDELFALKQRLIRKNKK
ncbi:MAG: nicotinate phosphoribosyltransferase, partial [Halanaerobium sp.]